MKAVQLLINSLLPEDLRNYDEVYDTKSLNKIMTAVASKYPDKFEDILHKISSVGRKASYYQGETITLKDLENVVDKNAMFAQMDAEIAALPKDKNFVKNKRDIFQKYNTLLEKETNKAALLNRNNLAMAILSGARGKSAQLKAMVSSPVSYSDYKGEPVDIFIRNSFAEGISPAAFAASTNGARSSVISSKVSTAKGGDLAKQMAQAAVDLVIRKNDCGTKNGIALPIDDPSLKGRVLARGIKGVPAGTVIDRSVLQDLRKKGVDNLEVRSAETCGVHNGLCSKCIGKYFNGGKWAPVGTHVGALAASSTTEPITQMALCLNELQLVDMADGSIKPIKDIQIDDLVLGADKEGHTFPVKVLNTYDQGIQKVRNYSIRLLETTEEIEVSCTKDHKFLNEYGDIVPIKELVESPFTALMTEKGLGVITSISPETDTYCRDIEVDHPDHLFVLTGGIITSNSAKHTAGMTQSKKTYSGLDALIQFTQSPEKFKDQGAVAELDGKVENIEEAPQGGYYVTINGQKHYTPQGHDLEVKVGDKVEAGDQLSEGLVDAEDVVKYKGLGAGRRYYAERLNKMLADSGAPSDKRNTEILARGALRHVRVTDLEGMGDYLPDDIVDYNSLQSTYKPSESAVTMNPKDAVGKYLQTPVMHYTIGTRITPKVAENLQKYDYNEILVDDEEPGFAPEMQRLRAAAHSNPDWFASQGTSYLTKQLNEASVKGDDTNILENADYRPRLAFGVGFGKNISQTGMF